MAFLSSQIFYVTTNRASRIIPHADPDQNISEKRDKVAKEIKLPKTGYFSLADPTAEVYSKSTEPFDPRKKGGRYKNEFIWNTNWQETMRKEEQLEKKRKEYVEGASVNSSSETGGIKFGILSDLNNLDIDLSDVLRKRRDSQEQQSASASSSSTQAVRASPRSPSPQLEPISRLNAEKLKRQNRGNTRTPSVTLVSTRTEDEGERDRLIEEERKRYEAKKVDFQVWTLALTALGGVATYTSYSPDVSASYLTGALGGLFYLRLLGRSVDAVGNQSLEAGASSLLSQPRLLIPVILTLLFNRWNVLYADKVGVTLQLLPMMIGFFTYKIAVLARESKDLMADLSTPSQSAGGSNGTGTSS
ncbi:hypothetical protein CEUSTIGMA_g10531.t1 [Chlamydomonas eustigma]|uniref:CGL160/ATPI domain-containing protein n=1 Tax=Chlamydomonas eustigma TaxID=1157962 RepID=A0A250XJ47_9CHLO|nr:hypothetical protein CEUSTIGMA_g10531.t1 [Chlamydomonas eustigma]|eukprot:GAX83105.1 hypothetical protein CEUSTIGMA_g10531.t1 [Chlamydomonas eustigma]